MATDSRRRRAEPPPLSDPPLSLSERNFALATKPNRMVTHLLLLLLLAVRAISPPSHGPCVAAAGKAKADLGRGRTNERHIECTVSRHDMMTHGQTPTLSSDHHPSATTPTIHLFMVMTTRMMMMIIYSLYCCKKHVGLLWLTNNVKVNSN